MRPARVVKAPGRFYAYVKGFWRKTIVTGDLFEQLPPAEQAAVMAHEQGHLTLHHFRRRWRMTLTARWWDWEDFLARLRSHEFEADAWAAQQGHLVGMVAFLQRLPPDAVHPLYPTPRERILRLRKTYFGE